MGTDGLQSARKKPLVPSLAVVDILCNGCFSVVLAANVLVAETAQQWPRQMTPCA